MDGLNYVVGSPLSKKHRIDTDTSFTTDSDGFCVISRWIFFIVQSLDSRLPYVSLSDSQNRKLMALCEIFQKILFSIRRKIAWKGVKLSYFCIKMDANFRSNVEKNFGVQGSRIPMSLLLDMRRSKLQFYALHPVWQFWLNFSLFEVNF